MHDTLDVQVLVAKLPSGSAGPQRFRGSKRSNSSCAVSLGFCLVHTLDAFDAFLLGHFVRTFLLSSQRLLLYLEDDNFAIFAGRVPLRVDARSAQPFGVRVLFSLILLLDSSLVDIKYPARLFNALVKTSLTLLNDLDALVIHGLNPLVGTWCFTEDWLWNISRVKC